MNGGATPLQALGRLHWRFLLPEPGDGGRDRCALVGADARLTSLATRAGLARQVGAELGERAGFDLVAALDGSGVSLETAADRVAPGGVLYLELRRPPRVGDPLGGLRARLARAGLALAGAWGVLPDLATPGALIPLDRPAALRWFLDTRLSVHSPARRALGATLGALGRAVPGALPRLVPGVAVIARRGEGPLSPALLAPDRLAAAGGVRVADDSRVLLLGPGSDRAVLLAFGPDDASPRLVLKAPLLPAFNERTANEQRTVARIREALPASLRDALPEPLGSIPLGKLGVGVETALPGTSLARRAGRWGAGLGPKAEDLGLAMRWLGAFHRSARPEGPGPDAGDWAAVRAEYDRAFTPDDGHRALLAAAEQRLARLPPLPRVWQHRDFNVWNLLRDGDRVRVVDWEGARPGPALIDALHLVTHWHESVRHLRDEPSQLRGLEELFLRRRAAHPATRTARAAIDAYLEELALDRAAVPPALVLLWMELAIRRRRQQLDAGEAGGATSANRNLPFLARLAAGRRELFDPAGAWA